MSSPLETFLEMGLVSKIHLISSFPTKTYDFIHDDPYEALFQENFPNYYDKVTPSVWTKTLVGATITALPGMLITYFITLVSYIFLLRYLIDSAMTETVVSMLVGGTKRKLALSIFTESTVLVVGAGVLGLLIHIIFYQPVFVPLNIHAYVTYRPLDYWNILIAVVAMSLILVTVTVAKYMKLPPIHAYRSKT